MPQYNKFENVENASLTYPITNAFPITPDDSNDLEAVVREIYVGIGGDLVVITLGGQTVTYTNVVAGMYYGGLVTRVLATGTTAGGLVGRY